MKTVILIFAIVCVFDIGYTTFEPLVKKTPKCDRCGDPFLYERPVWYRDKKICSICDGNLRLWAARKFNTRGFPIMSHEVYEWLYQQIPKTTS